jgi:hypothetical protein
MTKEPLNTRRPNGKLFKSKTLNRPLVFVGIIILTLILFYALLVLMVYLMFYAGRPAEVDWPNLLFYSGVAYPFIVISVLLYNVVR